LRPGWEPLENLPGGAEVLTNIEAARQRGYIEYRIKSCDGGRARASWTAHVPADLRGRHRLRSARAIAAGRAAVAHSVVLVTAPCQRRRFRRRSRAAVRRRRPRHPGRRHAYASRAPAGRGVAAGAAPPPRPRAGGGPP